MVLEPMAENIDPKQKDPSKQPPRFMDIIDKFVNIIDKNFILILIWFTFLLIFLVISFICRESLNTIINTADLTLTISAAIASLVIISIIIWMSIVGREEKDLWFKFPLGLPAGSIRALIALIFVFSILLASSKENLPGWLMGILGTILGFYFGERKTDGDSHDAERKISEINKICSQCEKLDDTKCKEIIENTKK